MNTTKLSKVNNNTISLNNEINPVNGIRANTCKEIDILINTITGTGATVNDNSQTAISTNATTLSSLFNNNTYLAILDYIIQVIAMIPIWNVMKWKTMLLAQIWKIWVGLNINIF